jgi:hypothetical protein
MALRMKDKVAKSPAELLKWIKDLNPGLHMEHWSVLDKQPKQTGQRLILLITGAPIKSSRRPGIKFS